ncbi:MAG: polyphosphate polymerase domain-containing protein [Mogibacterium sp.]|nr:polyphosphate polymerase domain-containing protein [Mogibacterium sp.]
MKSYQKTFQRTEKKYFATAEQYRELVRALDGLVAPDEYGQTEILNIYYDTPDFRLIRRSLEKPLYKEKLRLRSYGLPTLTGTAFIELKKKYKGVVYKRRIGLPYRDALRYLNTGVYLQPLPTAGAGNERQIFKEIDYFRAVYPDLGPAMVIAYDRLAVNWIDAPSVRITADTNVRYRLNRFDLRCGGDGALLFTPGTRLLEVKFQGSMPVELAHALSEFEIFPTSVSKYGRAYQTITRQTSTEGFTKAVSTFGQPAGALAHAAGALRTAVAAY